VARSLAALPVPAPVREAIPSVADEDVQASAGALSTLETTGASVPRPSRGSRHCVLRPHAWGGLGEVLVAEDTEVRREVALKEIRQEYANDPHAGGRFLLKSEVNGRL
jgi:hypothetical protein